MRMPTPEEAPHPIVAAFRAARLAARSLPAFPGAIPETLEAAYRLQDEAIRDWPDRLSGWKIGLVPPHLRERLGTTRLAGPIFAGGVRQVADGEPVEFPIIPGGLGAVEAEFVFRLAEDAPASDDPGDEALSVLAGTMHIGVELAGSPLAALNDLGPCAIVSDFGTNAGLLLGPPVPEWRRRSFDRLTTRTLIDGREVGTGSAAAIPGGRAALVQLPCAVCCFFCCCASS